MNDPTVALFGATGFIGSAVRDALERANATPVSLRAPRIRATGDNLWDIDAAAARESCETTRIAKELQGLNVVVNAAGEPNASSNDRLHLVGANALAPRVIADAAAQAGVERFVHISSAVVQGNRPLLDETDNLRPFSPYSESKALGERTLLTAGYDRLQVVAYRPPSVHAQDRRVTRRIARVAASPFSTVARPGSQPSPQALLANVASAIAFLATWPGVLPERVIHPWEGITAAGLLSILGGGREPRRVPTSLAKMCLYGGTLAGHFAPSIASNTRRIELLWFGQQQSRSWLTAAGWVPPVGSEGWAALSNSS